MLKRVPYSWLILAGLEFVLLLPGLVLIDEEEQEDAAENTVFENTLAETPGIENTVPENKLPQLNDEVPNNTESDNTVLEENTSTVSKHTLGRAPLSFAFYLIPFSLKITSRPELHA